MKTIVCFHLFNDYSGSPKVLRMVLEGLLNKGYNVDLVSSCGGVLDELEGMRKQAAASPARPVPTMWAYLFSMPSGFLGVAKAS